MSGLLARLGRSPQAARTMALGIVLVAVLTFAGSAYGLLTATDRVDAAAREAAASQGFVNVIVEVGFKPEAFHMRQLQARGTVGAVTDAGIQLRRVSAANLDLLARTPWISRVRLLEEGR